MNGLSRRTGRTVSAQSEEYVCQSVADIVTTPIGSRCMLRDYGSYVPELVDQPLNAITRLKLYGATAMAIMRWSRRARLKRVQLDVNTPAAGLTLDLVRTDLPRPRAISLGLPLSNLSPNGPHAPRGLL